MSQLPFMTDLDKYLFAQGTHERIYEKMGAHTTEIDGIKGVHFAVWAPNAKDVYLMGEFNYWSSMQHPMQGLGESGIWTRFEPGLGEGALYKFRIIGHDGQMHEKADPYAFAAELRPQTASAVFDVDQYTWGDEEWMTNRKKRHSLSAPISVYEVHLGSWRRGEGNRYLTYAELAEQLVAYVKEMGYTHVELLPISEHPLDASWGYQTVGYYAPTSRFGSPRDFQAFVDTLHQAGIGVIIDWVPAHFPKDPHGLGQFDGTNLYEHSDPREREHKDWGTYIFNYGRHEVRSFLISNALFWFDKYHIDGMRVDAVASMLYRDYSRQAGEWIPNIYGGRENLEAIHFLKRFNEVVHGIYPDILTFAEESTAWPQVSRPVYVGGLGFDLKWNMGWMHDTLKYMHKDSIYRRYHHHDMTFALIYAFNENFILPLSHDEVVHMKGSMIGQMSGDDWQKFANLRAYYAFMWGHPGKKLLFMGSDFGQWKEWNFNYSLDWDSLDWEPHQGILRLVKELNHLYRNEPALYEVDFEPPGFSWIDANDTDNSIFSFMRHDKTNSSHVIFVCNLTPVPRYNYRIGVPEPGFYVERINTDAQEYWGSGVGNAGGLEADAEPWHGQPYSLNLTLPPLATLIFKRSEKETP
jgi:1,4-alpha-glucan branching enzyme